MIEGYRHCEVSCIQDSLVGLDMFEVDVVLADGEEQTVEAEVDQEDYPLDDVFSPHAVVGRSVDRRPV